MNSGNVRPLRHADLEALAELRLRCFRHGRYRDRTALAKHFESVFLDNPWLDTGVQALVYEDGHGRVLGFRGLVGRPMQFRGKSLVAAISSQFMVDPEARSEGVAFALMRASLSGPQEIMIADLANPAAKKLWGMIRGVEITELALQWRRPLTPMRWMAGRLGSSPSLIWSLRLARPILFGLDKLAASIPEGPFRPCRKPAMEPVSVKQHAELLNQLTQRYELVPDYHHESLAWTLDMLAEGLKADEQLVARRVVDQTDGSSGFFLAVVQPGGVTSVLQLGAASSGIEATMAGLLHTAAIHHCREVTGRLQPEFLPQLATPPGCLTLSGPRVMVATRRPELLDCLCSGKAWLTRLEGEWWMGF